MRDNEAVVARAGRIKEQIKALEDEYTELLDSLGNLPIDSYVYGEWILKVQPNRRFDAVTAKKNLTPEQYESILKPTPNSALAKALLDEDTYALAQRDYDPKRTLVRVTDAD